MHKWLSRVWRLTLEHDAAPGEDGPDDAVAALRKATHQRIAAISDDFDAKKYNIAIAKMMELTNALQDAVRAGVGGAPAREAIDSLLLMLAPVCPFVTEELWSGSATTGRCTTSRGRSPTTRCSSRSPWTWSCRSTARSAAR